MSAKKTDMLDKEIECVEKGTNCEGTFIFTEGEQKYYSDKGLYEPKRCKPCRKERKENLRRQKQTD